MVAWSVARSGLWPEFMSAIGATRIQEDTFHPFFHEIVTVEEADDPDQAPSLVHEHWTGALAGSLLLVRSGVTVHAGRNQLDSGVAAQSHLYWAWYRRNRRVSDLSHGWGQNSQWGTDFRRDYVTSTDLHYNVDGPNDRPALSEDDDLIATEQLELLRFRHGLHRDLGADRWPFRQHLVEARST